MSAGILTLNRFNGQEQFAIAEAIIRIIADDDVFELSFEIETDRKPLKTLPDTARFPAQPNAEFTVRLPEFSWDKLAGRQFEIPAGYDEDEDEFTARIYYYEHQSADNAVIKIIEHSGDRYRVVITAACPDVNHYDGSKLDTTLEIEAWFSPLAPRQS